MKYLIDLHVHTIGSHHAYSTIEEIARAAAEKGLKAFAITDHGPMSPDGAHRYYFSNMKVIPSFINGVRVFKGIEANFIDKKGNVDIDENDVEKFDIILAGFHKLTPYGDSEKDKNTETLINAIKKGQIDVISHPGNPSYTFDYGKVLLAAKEHNVAIEVNNSSFTVSRIGSAQNCFEIIKIAKKIGNFISIGSDAHISFDVGNLNKCQEILEELGYDKSLIINESIEKVEEFLKLRRN